MRKRTAFCVFLLVMLLTAAVVGAASFEVEKWSGNTGLPVIETDPDGLVFDRENSYAWAMAEYGDYLYVGTNRNYLRQMFETMFGEGPLPMGLDNVFPPKNDYAGKIYRKPLDGSGGWELFYDSPKVTVIMTTDPTSPDTYVPKPNVILDYGYRTMEVYDGALYVVTYSFFESPYSRVLKLPTPTGTSADLQEVLRVANQGGSGLRSIGAYDGALFIGTEDLNVWRNPAPSLQTPLAQPPLMMNVEVMGRQIPVTVSDVGGKEGWTLVGKKSSFPGVATGAETQGWGGLWDFVSYNGWLYASMADPVNGFSLYKANGPSITTTPTPISEDLWAWTPIVASLDVNPGAQFPQGLGNDQNAALTMTVFDGFVYAGTFSNWKDLIAYAMNPTEEAMDTVMANWTPPQVYRFDANDAWEMIVGDNSGQAASPYFENPSLSGWRAGFYDNAVISQDNYSTNRYIWRMAVHDDRLFMGTMDMMTILEVMAENQSGDVEMQQMIQMLQAANPYNPSGFDLYVTEDGVNIQPITRDGGFGEIFGGTGDRYNYGARTLVSASDGNLYLGTSNPFYGCQVWKLAVVPEGDDDDDTGGGGGGGCMAIPPGKFFLLFLLPIAFLTGLIRIGR
jgi:hypothetical protein